MNRVRSILTTLLLVAVAACSDEPITSPVFDERGDDLDDVRLPFHTLAVLNWNLYIGTDVDAVIGALADGDPSNDLEALNAAVAELVATDFPSRASAIADQIALRRPDVIGLQEVTIIDIDLRALGGPEIRQDFLAILQAELATRNLDYDVAAIVENIDAAPALPPGVPATVEIRIRDRDALLTAADRVTVHSSVARTYNDNVGPVAPGVALTRGFVKIDATVHGIRFAVANTHLEAGLDNPLLPGLRALQAAELMAELGTATPAVIMGDFNDVPGSLMHGVVTGAGFVDLWPELRRRATGLTCCHVSNLSNSRNTFEHRIDYIFVRLPQNRVRGVIWRLGALPFQRTPGPFYPLWPSDHAGLAARIVTPPALLAAR